MINQLDHSANNLHIEILSLKKTLASVNEELVLKDKAVSLKFAFLYELLLSELSVNLFNIS